MQIKEYNQLADRLAPKKELFKHCLNAFIYGGVLGIIAQGFLELYMYLMGVSEKEATPMMIITLVLIACVLTGLGVYDKLAQHAGAGLFIPITGFANAMSSCALDCKNEGLIYGIGSNIFKLGGSVITYGIVSASLLGVIRYVFHIF